MDYEDAYAGILRPVHQGGKVELVVAPIRKELDGDGRPTGLVHLAPAGERTRHSVDISELSSEESQMIYTTNSDWTWNMPPVEPPYERHVEAGEPFEIPLSELLDYQDEEEESFDPDANYDAIIARVQDAGEAALKIMGSEDDTEAHLHACYAKNEIQQALTEADMHANRTGNIAPLMEVRGMLEMISNRLLVGTDSEVINAMGEECYTVMKRLESAIDMLRAQEDFFVAPKQ